MSLRESDVFRPRRKRRSPERNVQRACLAWLRARSPRNKHARFNAYRRAAEAVNCLGPDLFPLITTAEEAISGTRPIRLPKNTPRNADRYELKGIVDVISSVRLVEHAANSLVKLFRSSIPTQYDSFDVIVDYKGMRRPSFGQGNDHAWNDHAWQIQTYAWLRSKRQDRERVGCGLIIYLNELFPSGQDIQALRDDHARKTSDVLTDPGSEDHYAIMGVTPTTSDGNEELLNKPTLSLPFRLRRAVRIIPVDQASQDQAAERIHKVVKDIEQLVANEHADGQIRTHWPTSGRTLDRVIKKVLGENGDPRHRRRRRRSLKAKRPRSVVKGKTNSDEPTASANKVRRRTETGRPAWDNIPNEPITLGVFMANFCEPLSRERRRCRRQALLAAARHGTVETPPLAEPHKQRKSKKYFVHDLLLAWASFQDEGVDLPDLKPECWSRTSHGA